MTTHQDTSTEREKLKPCPFCGGNPAFNEHDDGCYFTVLANAKAAPKGDVSGMVDLIPAWNRRALTQPQAQQAAAVPAGDDWATIAGLESSVGHLSALVDEQRALLVESEDVFGRDGHGGRYEDGECNLIDRIRAHLEMTAPPPNGTTAKEQGNEN